MLAPAAASLFAVLFGSLSEPIVGPVDDFIGGMLELALMFALLGAYPATVALGLPIYLALRGRVRATLLRCALIAALVGLVPLFVWRLVTPNGPPDMKAVLLVALSGAFGGIVFWLVAHEEINGELAGN
jgi:hypothetical protein